MQKVNDICPATYRFVRDKYELLKDVMEFLAKANRQMKRYVDLDRTPIEFRIGDSVMLKLMPQIMNKIKSTEVQCSLVQRYDGPFIVVKRIWKVAYQLKLHETYKLHPTFHVSFLKPYHGDPTDPRSGQTCHDPPFSN